MHNNYYLFQQLATRLEQWLYGAVVSECFSQSKEELIIRFESGTSSSYIRVSVSPTLSCITFPDNFQRARKNSVDLFDRIIGEKLLSVTAFENERSIALRLTNDLTLLFKMHGNRSNLLLFDNKPDGPEIFRKNLVGDLGISLPELDRFIDWSFETFKQFHHTPQKIYFTFGKIVWQYLDDLGYQTASVEKKWELIQKVKTELTKPQFYIIRLQNTPLLSLVPFGDIKKSFDDPMAALNEYYYTFTQTYALENEKEKLLHTLRARLQSSKSYYEKTFGKLVAIEQEQSYRMSGDLIMANLNNIRPGVETVTVSNFYNDNLPIQIKLKKDLSAQKNAEIYYRKAKNQQVEITYLQTALASKEKAIEETTRVIDVVTNIPDLKSLRKLKSEMNLETAANDTSLVPYHEFIVQGYKIWVGRNAEMNDVLTLKYSFKEDLWLHAKDVAGSHVLIKHQAGKVFPKEVIERAAQLAAYNSKRKNDSLCPVTVTPKKFVRKRKGDPAGAVVVEREDVILVEPKLHEK